MTRTLCIGAVAIMIASLAWAQDNSVLPPATAGVSAAMMKGPGKLPFCPPKTCLYYAGDFDTSNGNGLFNADSEGLGIEGQVWAGVKPTKNATVTGSTFNQFFTAGGVGTNPTPFAVQIGITQGNAGKTVCNTSGTATESPYGESAFGLTQYSYTVKKFSKACKFKKGTLYFVNLLPTFSNDTYGYLANVGPKAKNHRGWPNQPNQCFFNGQAFGADYVSCGSQGSGDELFSIALTGTE